MASEPRKSSTNQRNADNLDLDLQLNNVDESTTVDFINPDFEFDQFDTELAATKSKLQIIFHPREVDYLLC